MVNGFVRVRFASGIARVCSRQERNRNDLPSAQPSEFFVMVCIHHLILGGRGRKVSGKLFHLCAPPFEGFRQVRSESKLRLGGFPLV